MKSFDELYDYKYCNFKKYADEFSRETIEDRILTILKIKSKEDEETFFRNLNKQFEGEIASLELPLT